MRERKIKPKKGMGYLGVSTDHSHKKEPQAQAEALPQNQKNLPLALKPRLGNNSKENDSQSSKEIFPSTLLVV